MTLEEEFQANHHRPHANNLRFFIEHTDGLISRYIDQVCWAPLCYYVGEDYRVSRDPSTFHDRSGTVATTADVKRVLISTLPHKMLHSEEYFPEYLRAVQTLLGHYHYNISDASLEDRRQNGWMLNMEGGLTVDEIGALLVQFRNLGEQYRFRMLNYMVDAGIPVHQALLWNQFFMSNHKGTIRQTNNSHTMLSAISFRNVRTNAILSLMDENAWFTPKGDFDSKIEGKLSWSFNDIWEEHHNEHGDGERLVDTIAPSQYITENDWGEKIVCYHPEKLTAIIKELCK